jgi:hypothetical protein
MKSAARWAVETSHPADVCDEIEMILNTYRRTMPETTLQILGLLRNL